MNRQLPKVCAFDFDGTLVDTMGGFALIAAEVLESHYGISLERGRQLYLETSGIPFFQQLEIIRPGGEHNAACAELFEARKLDGFFDAAPSDETREGLAMLRQAGIRVVISSNNFQHLVDAFLDRHALPVDLALGFVHGELEKGGPHFEKIREVFGVESAEILFCGDSLKDAERAIEAGTRFAGITGTFEHAQFEVRFPGVETAGSILELAQRLLSATGM
ncbi:MAG: HAD family hydrolase [Deltaproteobacteria bacterium]|nr:HAD family hydrolase [Deltaproteobacteria bacterium]